MPTQPLPRHPAPKLATVTLLDAGSAPITTVPVAALAYTRALAPESVGADATTAAVQVCAHFERHGACNRGHRCRWAHIIASSAAMPAAASTGDTMGVTVAVPPAVASTGVDPAPLLKLPAETPAPSTATVAAAHGADAKHKVHTSRGWRHAVYDASPREGAV